MVGSHFPRWQTIYHGGKPFSTVGFPACLLWISLWMGVWRLGKQEIPPWKMISHRGKWFPTVENGFPPWEIISHRGISYPTALAYSLDPIFETLQTFSRIFVNYSEKRQSGRLKGVGTWLEIIFHGGKSFSRSGISCLPGLQTPIHRDIHKEGVAEGRPSFVEAAGGRLPYGWVSGG